MQDDTRKVFIADSGGILKRAHGEGYNDGWGVDHHRPMHNCSLNA